MFTLLFNKYFNNNFRFSFYAGDNVLDQLFYKKENNSISNKKKKIIKYLKI